ncbi:hypothetical protein Nepgr_002868 [Nepenthes gracilis]|uniref:Myb-like domain-containing protein n=1 Tax=Nepenthes gracilis TaxID=150966 RepID=A0AAD3PA49_NEPGR|nr:hypothetical protein Nepgr_002868 [Nepenthes gracilis]
MLEASSGLQESSGDGSVALGAAHEERSGGGGAALGGRGSSIMAGIGEEEKGIGEDFGDRSSAGNRWPRQETLALLKIRSDMDAVFRDSSLKGPLWEDISVKMAELGYHRSAKKCKEKFENVYKYHKRTKEGRVGKPDGKTYRFFNQLEALENHPPQLPLVPLSPPCPPPPQAAVPVSMATPPAPTAAAQVTVALTTPPPGSIPQSHCANVAQQINPTTPLPTPAQAQAQLLSAQAAPLPAISSLIPSENQLIQPPHLSHIPSSPSSSPTSSSSTSSDEEILGRKRKSKRKWKDFFGRLMKEVVHKQEKLQRRFLEAIEKREHDKLVREERWKQQEMARLSREHDILVQERSAAAAKDTALIAILQKISEQQQIPLPLPFSAQPQGQTQTKPSPSPSTSPVPPQQSQSQPRPVPEAQSQLTPPQAQPLPQMPPQHGNIDASKTNRGENAVLPQSSSRWPKAEVQALIKLRTSQEQNYQDSGPKGPLWEEISASMRKLGYNRSAKRCKEKWENINKYFKKVKESSKKRPEDSKTCPYFHQLDAIYREKNKQLDTTSSIPSYRLNPPPLLPPEGGSMAEPIMARPEQQWPLSPSEEPGSYDVGPNQDDEGDENEEDEPGYETVPKSNDTSSMSSMAAAGNNGSHSSRGQQLTIKT